MQASRRVREHQQEGLAVDKDTVARTKVAQITGFLETVQAGVAWLKEATP